MATYSEKALANLLDKLSAVRATLKGDEREILDNIIMGAQMTRASAEVEQHASKLRVTM